METEIEESVDSINLESVCRTCLSDGDELTSLFSEVVIEDPQIEESVYVFLYEIVSNVTAIQVIIILELYFYIHSFATIL